MITVDTCGKDSPAPLIMIKRAIKRASAGEHIEVITDDLTAFKDLKDYLSELSIGFREIYDVEKQSLQFTVPEKLNDNLDTEDFCFTAPVKDYVVVIRSDKMGVGDDDLGVILLLDFMNHLIETDELPSAIILYNGGVKTALKGTDTAKSMQKLEDEGVTILTCRTSLDFYGVKDKLAVGIVSDMYKIAELVSKAGHVVYP